LGFWGFVSEALVDSFLTSPEKYVQNLVTLMKVAQNNARNLMVVISGPVSIHANGDKYDGEWKDNKMHGKGIFTYDELKIPNPQQLKADIILSQSPGLMALCMKVIGKMIKTPHCL
jgi:hypothetical protein